MRVWWSERLSRHLKVAWLQRGALACVLWPLAALMWVLVRLRKLLFQVGVLRAQRLPVPVVVVGNVIVGGAGKTPTVMAVVALLQRHGFRPGIVSRGYGRHANDVQEVKATTPVSESGDEPLLLHLRCQVPVWVGRDRVAAARRLLQSNHDVNIVVSDDGLQHHRLHRDAQVVVFDERGVGNGWLLPAGPLREPLPDSVPARSLVVYNAEQPSMRWPGQIVQRSLSGAVLLEAWWEGQPATHEALQALQDQPIWAAAGMAQPERFFSMLRSAGLTQLRALPLPDHFDFNTLPWPADALDVIVTEKDAVKLQPARLASRAGKVRVWVAPLNFALHPASCAALLALLPTSH